MTWKSYAAVSGATVLAGWLASSPPSNAPVSTRAAGPASPRRAPVSGTDIEAEAARLHARLGSERVYAEPQRDPFRFAARDEAKSGSRPLVIDAPSATDAPIIPDTPRAPVIGLSGVAEEQVAGRIERTAVLSSPMGVLLVRENEDVLGYYQVVRIENEAIELRRVGDGSTVRVTLGSSQP